MANLKDLKGMVNDTHSGKEWHAKHGLPKSSAAHKALNKKADNSHMCKKCGSAAVSRPGMRCSDCI